MYTNKYRALFILAPLLYVLSACSQAIYDNTPYCLDPPNAEVQSFGSSTTPGAIDVTPRTQRDVEISINRVTLPAGDPVYFVPGFDPLPPGASPGLLVSTTEGITVSASREPFTSDTAAIHVTVPASLTHSRRAFQFGLKRVKSRYADTSGSVGFTLTC